MRASPMSAPGQSNRVGFVTSAVCPVYPKQQTFPDPVGTSHLCQNRTSGEGCASLNCRRGLLRPFQLHRLSETEEAQMSKKHKAGEPKLSVLRDVKEAAAIQQYWPLAERPKAHQ